MLVNIIHPYTFKLIGNAFQIGPVPEFEERDKNLSTLVAETLAANGRVIVHRDDDEKSLRSAMQDMAFRIDPLFSFLFDSRVESVVTTHYGLPIPDKRPDAVPKKMWTALRKTYTSHSTLQRKISKPRTVFFVGGVLENCVVNAACYFHKHYQTPGQQLLYVKELCVSQDTTLLEKIQPQFDERGIQAISYQDAMKRISGHRLSTPKPPA